MKNILIGEYDFIFGIGEACSCSSTLRSKGLQFESYPLDWLYGGNLRTRTDFLLNGFKDFINFEDLVKIGQREHPLPCDIYKNTKNDIVFNHDFALNEDLKSTYSAVKEKYDRRVKRLYNRLNDAENILIVYISTPSRQVKIFKTIKLIKQCFRDIKSKFSDKNVSLLFLGHKKWRLPVVIKLRLSKNIMFAVTNYRCKDKNAETYMVDEKVLSRFFSNITLNKKVIKNHEPKNQVMT